MLNRLRIKFVNLELILFPGRHIVLSPQTFTTIFLPYFSACNLYPTLFLIDAIRRELPQTFNATSTQPSAFRSTYSAFLPVTIDDGQLSTTLDPISCHLLKDLILAISPLLHHLQFFSPYNSPRTSYYFSHLIVLTLLYPSLSTLSAQFLYSPL